MLSYLCQLAGRKSKKSSPDSHNAGCPQYVRQRAEACRLLIKAQGLQTQERNSRTPGSATFLPKGA